jgi:hypothetical protein
MTKKVARRECTARASRIRGVQPRSGPSSKVSSTLGWGRVAGMIG